MPSWVNPGFAAWFLSPGPGNVGWETSYPSSNHKTSQWLPLTGISQIGTQKLYCSKSNNFLIIGSASPHGTCKSYAHGLSPQNYPLV